MRVCRICNIEKCLDQFYPSVENKTLFHDCKECVKIRYNENRYLKEKIHLNEFIYKKCRTHGILPLDKIIICNKIKNGKRHYFLRCIDCHFQYRKTQVNEDLKKERIDINKNLKCSMCKSEKKLTDYWDIDLKSRFCRCKECRENMYKKHREIVSMSHRVKLPKAEYDLMLEKQNFVCFICKNPEKAKFKKGIKNLAIDHCHASGKIRGLLCQSCNQGIGIFKDSLEYLRAAADYLDYHNENP